MSKWSRKAAPAPEKNIGIVFAESALAGLIMQETSTIHLCTDIEPEHFADRRAAAILECARDLVARGLDPNLGLLFAEVEKRLNLSDGEINEYFHTVGVRDHGLATEANINELIKTIREKSVERAVARSADTLSKVAQNDGISAETKIAEAEAELQKVKQLRDGDRPLVSAAEMVMLAMNKSMEVAERGTLPGIASGFSELDELLSGFSPSELIILAARPSMGKTALALSIAHSASAKQDRPVLMVSLEMDAAQVGMRWASMISGVPMVDIKNGRLEPYQMDKIQKAHEAHFDVPFNLDETPGLNFPKIANRARMMHAQTPGGLGILIVDYLQLINTEEMPGDNRSEHIGAISVGLKRLARELKIPVLALAQLNRSLEKRQDKRPIMSDLRDSGNIEQDADVIMFLYRDEVYHRDSPDAGKGEIIIAKQRNGSIGTVMVDFDGAHCMFRDPRGDTSKLVMKRYGT